MPIFSYVAVARCATRPKPIVPASVVQCVKCGAGCWLSKKTGESEVAEAKRLAPAYRGFLCLQCLLGRRLTDLAQ